MKSLMKKSMMFVFSISTMLMISGCGGSSTTSTKTGTSYYIDAAVAGVNYICGSEEGITGADGSFTFEEGASCTFYLGDIELRNIDEDALVDGQNVYETDVNISRVLQSLDSDGDPDNGITLDEDIIEALVEANITELPDTVEEMDDMLGVIEDANGTVVTEEEAHEHMMNTFFVGKTRYFANDKGGIGYRNYDEDGSYTGMVGTTAVSGTYEISGNTVTITRTSPSPITIVLTYLGEEGKGLGFNISVNAGESFKTASFESNVDRDNYTTAYLESFFVGETRHFANEKGGTGFRSYAADGTYTGSITSSDGSTLNVSGTYTIDGYTVTINRTSPSPITLTLAFSGEEDGGQGFEISVNGGESFDTFSFRSEVDRDNYTTGYLESFFVGNTRYFANTQGGTGYRNYAENGTYTGMVGTTAVSGTYAIDGFTVTINRTSSMPAKTIVLSYTGEEGEGEGFNITVDGGTAFQTVSFETEQERDNYIE